MNPARGEGAWGMSVAQRLEWDPSTWKLPRESEMVSRAATRGASRRAWHHLPSFPPDRAPLFLLGDSLPAWRATPVGEMEPAELGTGYADGPARLWPLPWGRGSRHSIQR